MREDRVSVYTQPNCLPCKRVIAKLKEAGIDFDVYDVTENDRAYEFIKGIGAKSVPVVTGAGVVITGYEPTQLRDLILTLNNERIHDSVYEGEGE